MCLCGLNGNRSAIEDAYHQSLSKIKMIFYRLYPPSSYFRS